MTAFRKRTYASLGEFLTDFWFPVKNRQRLRRLREQALVSPAFRERLMIAVTAVNGCRYCSYFHAREALRTGLAPAEISGLLAGSVTDCPDDEAVALAYAQHWAETDGHPDPEATRRLEHTYGAERAGAIHLVLRMIRMGNLSGNSLDYLLYRASFGRWGGAHPSQDEGLQSI
jgi:AhpD family alkylhydroperoxidase